MTENTPLEYTRFNDAVAAFVVAVGKPAAIVKVKVFVAVVGWESVTLKVKLLETTDSVGVPVI